MAFAVFGGDEDRDGALIATEQARFERGKLYSAGAKAGDVHAHLLSGPTAP